MSNVLNTIGNTPLIKLNTIPDQSGAQVYLKLEYFNPTASYKDRMALAVIEEAEKRNELKQGMTVIENTAGSTGTSLAFVCSAKGYKFKAISSNAFSKEKLMGIQMFGGELEIINNDSLEITPDLIPRLMTYVKKLSFDKSYFWTRQFENPDTLIGYSAMAREIVNQIELPIHTFCAAVGTAGMFVGVGGELAKVYNNINLIALEPASSPLLSKGFTGTHNVEGISAGFMPPFLNYLNHYNVQSIEELQAINMANRLVNEEGVLAGKSTGLNVAAAVNIAKSLTPNDIVITVACDSGMKYLSTGLYSK
ncbi:MAG TPA: cysteine synthase family protein [Saprospiraceae bacterium]|nr:cysteine synthase family protein [Saprospiraceae bacterium]